MRHHMMKGSKERLTLSLPFLCFSSGYMLLIQNVPPESAPSSSSHCTVMEYGHLTASAPPAGYELRLSRATLPRVVYLTIIWLSNSAFLAAGAIGVEIADRLEVSIKALAALVVTVPRPSGVSKIEASRVAITVPIASLLKKAAKQILGEPSASFPYCGRSNC
ncbi:MAG: hypothetical protein JOS17DRAFT_580123, partial [Linnemannia elongata]